MHDLGGVKGDDHVGLYFGWCHLRAPGAEVDLFGGHCLFAILKLEGGEIYCSRRCGVVGLDDPWELVDPSVAR